MKNIFIISRKIDETMELLLPALQNVIRETPSISSNGSIASILYDNMDFRIYIGNGNKFKNEFTYMNKITFVIYTETDKYEEMNTDDVIMISEILRETSSKLSILFNDRCPHNGSTFDILHDIERLYKMKVGDDSDLPVFKVIEDYVNYIIK